jgi:hypothetical protein
VRVKLECKACGMNYDAPKRSAVITTNQAHLEEFHPALYAELRRAKEALDEARRRVRAETGIAFV